MWLIREGVLAVYLRTTEEALYCTEYFGSVQEPHRSPEEELAILAD